MPPKIFIASSSESLKWADAVQRFFSNRKLYATVWNQGAFPPSNYPLKSLLETINNFDFGVFIFSFDDFLEKRGKSCFAVRDNLLFELGLFIAHLGIEHNFIFIPDNVTEFHWPSDLGNLTIGKYQANNANTDAGIGAACTEVLMQIERIRPSLLLSGSLNRFIFNDEEKPTAVIAHCADTDNYARYGIAAPGGTLIKNITDSGVNPPELITVHKPDADWTECEEAKTIFVVDSPSVNPNSKYVLDNYRNILTGGSVYHVTEHIDGIRIQKIIANSQRYFSNKHSKTTKEKLFGNFLDYLVVMRLPGAIINNEINDDRIIWLVYGTTTKGTHAGAHLFRKDNIDQLDEFLAGKGQSLLDVKYFEMVFEISDRTQKVENFNDFSLVHFAELRPKIECCAGDPPPFGIERFFRNAELKKDIPIYSVHLDPIAACNFKCPGCIESHVREKNLVLSMRGISRILTDLHKAECQDLHFYGGEPTLHPDFNLIVDMASSMGFRMMVVTNGSLLNNPALAQSLRNAPNMHVRVSLDAHSQATHRKFHGLKQSHQQVDIEQIKEATINLIQNRVSVSISYLLYEASLNEIEKACEFWKSNGATSFNPRVPMARNGTMTGKLNVIFDNEDKRRLRSIVEKYTSFVILPDWLRTWLNFGDEPKTEKEFPVCYSGYYRIGISPYTIPGSEGNLPRIRIPFSDEEIRVTDDAWISTCLYYRYDERFGCMYPKDFSQWCKDERLAKLVSIQPNQKGFCDKTICMQVEANQKIYSSLFKDGASTH